MPRMPDDFDHEGFLAALAEMSHKNPEDGTTIYTEQQWAESHGWPDADPWVD